MNKKHILTSTYLGLWLCVSALLPRLAAAEPAAPEQFRIEALSVAGRLLSVRAEDLDGDGKRDLIVLWVSGSPGNVSRHIALFFDQQGFRPTADQDLLAPADASCLMAADLDGDGKRELILGNAHGLSTLSLVAERRYGPVKPLLGLEGIALPVDDEGLPFLDLARDWDGDGKVEIFVPLIERIAIVGRVGAEWRKEAELVLAPRPGYLVRDNLYEPWARNFSLRIALTVPELVLGDYDGDGRRDLIALIDDQVSVYHGEPGGLFSSMPSARIPLRLRGWKEASRGNGVIRISVLDIDGDGIADLVANKVTGGLQSMHAQTALYLGRPGGGYDKPVQVIAREGFAGALSFADLDGDHRPELIMPYTRVGFAEAARILLTRRLSVGFEVHRNLGARGFDNNPAVVRPVDFPIDYSVGADLDAPLPSLAGDFNGDGTMDFAAAKSSDTLGVWLGGGKQLIAEYPKALAHVPSSRYWQVLDLDGDRFADILLFYRHQDTLEGRLLVLRNTHRGW